MAGSGKGFLICSLVMMTCCFWWMPQKAGARHGQGYQTVVNTDAARSVPYRQRATAEISRERPGTAEEVLHHWESRHAEENDGGKVMRLWNVSSVNAGGTLLFSDSPESVTRDGILYSDTVAGDARILFYHLNSTGQRKRVAVVLENMSGGRNTVRITRGGLSDPGDHYLRVGKDTQTEYFGTPLQDAMVLPREGVRLLQEEMEQLVLEPGELVYGVYDFHAEHTVRVSVILYPVWENPVSFLRHAAVLPKDAQRLRGTFHGMNRIISSSRSYDPSRDGIVYFPIGDDDRDRFLRGVDATDGSSVVNYGNYGVLYQIQIPTKESGRTTCFLSPRGGVYAGAMTVREDNGRSRLLLTPGNSLYFGDETDFLPRTEEMRRKGMEWLTEDTELSNLGTYRGGSRLSFEYSPPGASNLPVNLILMPAESK